MPAQRDYSWTHLRLGQSELLVFMDFSIGDKVFLIMPLPYLKTADPMPMLRPPDLVSSDEIGEIVGLISANTVKVLFRRGIFLIPIDHLAKSPTKGAQKSS